MGSNPIALTTKRSKIKYLIYSFQLTASDGHFQGFAMDTGLVNPTTEAASPNYTVPVWLFKRDSVVRLFRDGSNVVTNTFDHAGAMALFEDM